MPAPADVLEQIIRNLRDDKERLQAEVDRVRRSEHVIWHLWENDLPPPWRAWRIQRRMGSGRQARRWTRADTAVTLPREQP